MLRTMGAAWSGAISPLAAFFQASSATPAIRMSGAISSWRCDQQRARLRAQRLLDEPFDGDAGLDHHDHRPPPARSRIDAVGLRHVAGRHGGDAVGLGQGVEDQRLARGMAQKIAQLRFERAAAGAGARLQAVDDPCRRVCGR